MNVWQMTLLSLLTTCFASFAWALKRHFVSRRMSPLMRMTAGLGLLSLGLHILAIFEMQTFSRIRLSLSLVLYVISLGLFWWTINVTRPRRLSVAFSSDGPHSLLQIGPYRFVRHPFYTAYSLFWMAGFVAALRWYLIPSLSVLLSLYFAAAITEETKFSNSEFRELYESYRARTGMFVPRLKGIRHVC